MFVDISAGVMVSTVTILLGLASAWGSLWAQLRNINKRLDTLNGSVQRNSENIGQNARDIAYMRGEAQRRHGRD